MAAPTTGYVNGSDVLLEIGGKAVGHCTSHTVSYSTESTDHSVKPVASAAITKALFKGKSVTGLSVSLSAEGLRFYGETEEGLSALRTAWYAGQSVAVKAYERESSASPYLSGNFIIISLEETSPAQDDATYSISLENDGLVSIPGTAASGGGE